MASTTDKAEYLAETKKAIANAILDQGGSVDEGDTFRSYAGKIRGIKGRLHCETAGFAVEAEHAERADRATETDHTTEADRALEADHATKADSATVAETAQSIEGVLPVEKGGTGATSLNDLAVALGIQTETEDGEVQDFNDGRVFIVNATSTDGMAYTATDDRITVKVGTTVVFVPDKNSTSAMATFNLNGEGAHYFRMYSSDYPGVGMAPTEPGFLFAGYPILLIRGIDSGVPAWFCMITANANQTPHPETDGTTGGTSDGSASSLIYTENGETKYLTGQDIATAINNSEGIHNQVIAYTFAGTPVAANALSLTYYDSTTGNMVDMSADDINARINTNSNLIQSTQQICTSRYGLGDFNYHDQSGGSVPTDLTEAITVLSLRVAMLENPSYGKG